MKIVSDLRADLDPEAIVPEIPEGSADVLINFGPVLCLRLTDQQAKALWAVLEGLYGLPEEPSGGG